MNWVEELNREIVACRRCPRLVRWREEVARTKRRAFASETYWGRPVPLFGDPAADRLIVGLAPAAHGANRTGQMFTGDRSGDWLYRALHKAGVASLPTAQSIEDGLTLRGVLIAASAHCAPPDNKPLPLELSNCRPFLAAVLAERPWRAILCLGGIAWCHVLAQTGTSRVRFGHGVEHPLPTGGCLIGSYHPSQQNTFTGRLTETMLDTVVARFMTA